MTVEHTGIDGILSASGRVSFTKKDISFMRSMMEKQRAKGLDVRFHPIFSARPEDALANIQDGFFVLHCPQIESDFVFLCENGGRGLFGGQKRSYRVFLGDASLDDFSPAFTRRSFPLAYTSINNIFRNSGLLTGMA